MFSLREVPLYFHTLRHLRPIQIFSRAWYRLYDPTICTDRLPEKSPPQGRWKQPALRQNSVTGPQEFSLLHKKFGLHGWHPEDLPKLWIYHLHYFDDCVFPESETHYQWLCDLIQDWIRENPPTSGIGWEPYPLSRRLINWIKGDLSCSLLEPEATNSLALQARYLFKRCEYYLQGNHLWVNGKALLFVGIYFGGHLRAGESCKWLEKGAKIICKELVEQVRTDGSHYEQSPMYHSLFLEDVLDLINICQAFQWWPDLLNRLRITASEMLDFLKGVCHPDGQICLFNDAAFNMSPSPGEIITYAKRLGVESVNKASCGPGWSYWPDSGMVRMDYVPWRIFFDTGPIGPDHIPGHAHADNLSMEISFQGTRLVVDTGTGEYGISPERLRQRSTSSHNTVVVDGEDSSEIWAGFRVARRAYPNGKVTIENESDGIVCEAGHKGYNRLPGKIVHWRNVTVRHDITIEDTLLGVGEHELNIQWHFHPDFMIIKEGNCFKVINNKNNQHICAVTVEGVASMHSTISTYHPEFGVSLPINKITGWVRTKLPAKLITTFTWLS